MELEKLSQVIQRAEVVYTEAQLACEYDRMAAEISHDLAERMPTVLCVMKGGLIVAGELLSRMTFPLQLDYAQVSRYKDDTRGGELDWLRFPSDLAGTAVLVIDDILDEGITLKAVIDRCYQQGAAEVKSAVLAVKLHDRKPVDIQSDYVGVTLEDRFVVGCGMDYRGYFRNLTAIYALPDNVEDII